MTRNDGAETKTEELEEGEEEEEEGEEEEEEAPVGSPSHWISQINYNDALFVVSFTTCMRFKRAEGELLMRRRHVLQN